VRMLPWGPEGSQQQKIPGSLGSKSVNPLMMVNWTGRWWVEFVCKFGLHGNHRLELELNHRTLRRKIRVIDNTVHDFQPTWFYPFLSTIHTELCHYCTVNCLLNHPNWWTNFTFTHEDHGWNGKVSIKPWNHG
jgi:hypothetical protein